MIRYLFFFLFGMMTFAATAQERGPRVIDPKERADKQTERMTADLTLDENQQERVHAINLKYITQQRDYIMAMRESGTRDREALRAQRETWRKDRMVELKQVLTTEQYKKQWQLEEERAAEMRERREQRREGGMRRGGRRDRSAPTGQDPNNN